MTDISISNKISQLPDSLKKEVMDFVDFLISRNQKSKTNLKEKERVFGSLKGKIIMSPDFDEPLEDFKEYMP